MDAVVAAAEASEVVDAVAAADAVVAVASDVSIVMPGVGIRRCAIFIHKLIKQCVFCLFEICG